MVQFNVINTNSTEPQSQAVLTPSLSLHPTPALPLRLMEEGGVNPHRLP